MFVTWLKRQTIESWFLARLGGRAPLKTHHSYITGVCVCVCIHFMENVMDYLNVFIALHIYKYFFSPGTIALWV